MLAVIVNAGELLSELKNTDLPIFPYKREFIQPMHVFSTLRTSRGNTCAVEINWRNSYSDLQNFNRGRSAAGRQSVPQRGTPQ